MTLEDRALLPAAEIRNRAAAWLIKRRDHDDWSTESQAELDAWLAESPAHKIAYLRVSTAWQRADRLEALRSPPQRRGWLAPMLKLGGAAAVAAAVAVAVVLVRPATPGMANYSTGVGGHEKLTLRDGSRIELNTSTALRIATEGNAKTVYLDKGEAFFRITHNPNRKFVVIAGSRRIIDLGTQFLVRRENDRLRVALYEGKAQFEVSDARGEQQTTLNPGDVVVATSNSLSVTRRRVDELSDELGWRRGLLVFHHVTLQAAAAEYNRYNLKKFVIADPQIAQLNINGALPANDTGAFTRSVKRLFDLKVEERSNEIVISR